MIDGVLRKKLEAGDPLLGVFVSIEAPTTVELLALAGVDYVMIDGEHNPIGPAEAAEMIRAGEARHVPVTARVGENSQQVISKYLDAGCVGIMTPMVESAADARRVVEAVKYPPAGRRGLAGVRANDFATSPEYTKHANESTVVIVQIETQQGIEKADEIVATPGVDVVVVEASVCFAPRIDMHMC